MPPHMAGIFRFLLVPPFVAKLSGATSERGSTQVRQPKLKRKSTRNFNKFIPANMAGSHMCFERERYVHPESQL